MSWILTNLCCSMRLLGCFWHHQNYDVTLPYGSIIPASNLERHPLVLETSRVN